MSNMVGNLNRKSKRIEFIEEQNMSKPKDTGRNNSKINEDFMDSNVIDLFKNVRYYSSGTLEEKVSQVLEVGQAKLCPYLSPFCDYYIIGKNTEIEETTDLDVTVVSQDWVVGSVECGKLLPPAAFSFSPSEDQLMSGVRVCISGVSRPDACSIWAMVKFNGGQVDTKLTEATTHLVATSDQGKLYEEALARSDVFVVTPDWITDSVRRKIKCIENLYHPRLLDTSGVESINTPQLAPTDQLSDASKIKTVPETSVVEDYNHATLSAKSSGNKRRSNLGWITNLFSTSSERTSATGSESVKKKAKIENKTEEENKQKVNDLEMIQAEGMCKKLLPARRVRGRPKGLHTKHLLKKEKAVKKSTKIKKNTVKRAKKSKASEDKNPVDYPFSNSAMLAVPDSGMPNIKSKIVQHAPDKANENCFSIDQNQNKIVKLQEAKMRHKKNNKLNPTTRHQVRREQLSEKTVSVIPTTQKQFAREPSKWLVNANLRPRRMTRKYANINSGTQQQLATQCATNQTKFNQTVKQQVESQCPNQIKLEETVKQKVANSLPTDEINGKEEEKQSKLISPVKRKLIEKENISQVLKNWKRPKSSKLSEMSNSAEGYSCEMCDKPFGQKRNLMVHIKTVHEGIRIPCAMCNHSASTKSNLNKHIARMHNAQMHMARIDNKQVDDSAKENKDTCPSNPISTPDMTLTRNGSFHKIQLAEKKPKGDQCPPALDTIKCNPTQPESPHLSQQHAGNSSLGKDLKQQEYPHNPTLKHHQTLIDSQPALSLSIHDVLPPNSNMVTSVPTTPANIKEITPVVRSWTVEETITQISLFDPKLAPHVQIFRGHEIDGQALLLLTPDMMVEYLDMKLGPALKVGSIAEKLKRNQY